MACLLRDVARQRHHRRRAEQADMDARRRETRRFGSDRQVAARDQLAAGGGGDAFDCGDHRLRQLLDRHHQVAAPFHQRFEIAAAAVGIGAVRGHFLHVVAGGKGRAIVRNDHGADSVVFTDRGELVMQRREHRLRQRIARLRPVEREQGNAADVAAQQNGRGRGIGAGAARGHGGRYLTRMAERARQGNKAGRPVRTKRPFDRIAGPSITKAPDGPAREK